MSAHTGSKADKTDQKLVFRVPVELHERIQEAAEADDRSMASWIRRVLERELDGQPQQIQT